MTRRNRYSNNDINEWFEHSVDLKGRRIYLSSVTFDSDGNEEGVNSLMVEFAIKSLELMKSRRKRVLIIMNNIGGDELHGLAIYDAIRDFPVPVDIEVYGHAMSMGAVILQAGRKRLLHPNSTLMIHEGYSSGENRPYPSAVNWAKHEAYVNKRIHEIFAERSGKYPSYWKRKCSHDYLMVPEEAVKEGLADKILYPVRALPCRKSENKSKKYQKNTR